MADYLRIALLFSFTPGYNEGVLRGISAFARPHKPWLFRLLDIRDQLAIRAYDPHGVICSVLNAEAGAGVVALGLPAVNVGIHDYAAPLPAIGNDDHGIGALAADHYLARGFTSFAFFASRPSPTASRRGEGFRNALAAMAHPCAWYIGGDIAPWLRGLPPRTAIFTMNDHDGVTLLEGCRINGMRVPEEVAVVGVDNIESLCLLALPPLSSVAVGAERIGWEAATALEELLAGRQPVLRMSVPPLGVVARRSSDLVATGDPHLAAALRFIGDHAGQAIGVGDVLRAVPIARRTLELRFRALLGRSVLGEIRRVRLERARFLLTTTDLAMPAVAQAAGFGNGKQFATVFGAAEGLSPLRYRQRFRIV